jgi:long-chain acyl-CoA synthetase
MYIGDFGKSTPDKPAAILSSTREMVTFQECDSRSNQFAHLLRQEGIAQGDSIAMLLPNSPRFFETTWAAQRSGLYYTPISTRLTPEEVAYILGDCQAKALVVSPRTLATAVQAISLLEASSPPASSGSSLGAPRVRLVLRDVVADASSTPGTPPEQQAFLEDNGFKDFDEAIASFPVSPIVDEAEGCDMLYSSGTTGKPKGVKLPGLGRPIGTPDGVTLVVTGLYGGTQDSIYLSPAPLYHAAPLRFCMAFQRIGATTVVMPRFDAEELLEAIQRYHVTHLQVVPTMFTRLLRLPEDVKSSYDLSSLQVVIHAAAPCPIEIKRAMIDWLGPKIYEYYAGTEANGFCSIDSTEWLAHPGSVGRSLLGPIHICGPDGEELPVGHDGMVYFEGSNFEYLHDPEKTRSSRHPKGWSSLGDIGHVDEEGYLYLTDRSTYMIVSGGVNIYPQEAENVLATHPKVADVAVFGVPDEDLGETVKAVVEPVDMAEAGPALEAELIEFCRSKLASYKCPRSIDFQEELPREPTGKLLKRLIRDRYWEGHQSRIL